MTFRRLSLVLLIAAGTACGAREENGAAAPDSIGTPGTPAPPPADTPPTADTTVEPGSGDQRPAARQDTVMVEGMPQVESATLVTSPSGFALPFSTYVPEGMEAEFAAPLAVRFIAAFGGTRNADAFMMMEAHDTARPAARDILERLMSARSVREHEVTQTQREGWAEEAIGFRAIASDGTNVTGSISVGEHNDRWFHIVRYYPVEYGDGLPPRLNTILRHWRWEDTGDPLR